MERHLWILRHATAEYVGGAGGDFTRHLTQTGREEAKNVGSWLRGNSVTFDQIVASPAIRTQETALIVGEELTLAPENISFDDTIYEASRSDLLELISSLSEHAHQVLLVGHNPGVEEFLGICTTDQKSMGARFLPASIAHISFPSSWQDALVGLGDFYGIRHVGNNAS